MLGLYYNSNSLRAPASETLVQMKKVTGIVECRTVITDTLPEHDDLHAFLPAYPCTGLERPLGLQEVEGPRISRQSAHASGKVVSRTHRSPLPTRKYLWYSFLLEAETTPGQ
jgi:hypothetical protein